MDKSQIPERVVFHNLKDGNVFFDCSPQEARVAVSAVKTFRDTGYTSELSKEIKDGEALILASTDHAQDTVQANYTCSHTIADGFAKVEKNNVRVSHIYMNALNYVDLRKWDRDTLDIETQASILKLGQMATLWGARLIVTRELEQGDIRFLGYDDPKNPSIYQLNVEYIHDEPVGPKDKLDLIMENLGIESPPSHR